MTKAKQDQPAALRRGDCKSSWRCWYGHVNHFSMGEGMFLSSSWEWCNHCGEGPSPVDRMRMQLDIINQWLRAGLMPPEDFHAMANWIVTAEEREWKFIRRYKQPVSREQRLAVKLLNALNRAASVIEEFGPAIGGRAELVRQAAEIDGLLEVIRFRSKVLVAAAGLDTDPDRYTDPMDN